MNYAIEDGLLLINGRSVKFVQATGWGKTAIKPHAIVLHDTAAIKPGSSVEWFDNPACKSASAHFVVERDGTVIQMVKLPYRAYHAGFSKFPASLAKKQTGNSVNPYAFGIEIMNPGMMERVGDRVKLIYHDQGGKVIGDFPISECREVNTKEHGHGWCQPYTDAQIERVIGICRALKDEYPSIEEILTHWIVSPKRKVDTTPLFPLEEVRRAVFAPGAEPQPVAPPPPVASAVPAPQPQAQTQVAWSEPAMRIGMGTAEKVALGVAGGGAVANKVSEAASGPDVPDVPAVDPSPSLDQLKTATDRINDGVSLGEAIGKITSLFHDNPWMWALLAGGLGYVAWKFARPFLGRISIAPKPGPVRDPTPV